MIVMGVLMAHWFLRVCFDITRYIGCKGPIEKMRREAQSLYSARSRFLVPACP
jgi:hypothetical protein